MVYFIGTEAWIKRLADTPGEFSSNRDLPPRYGGSYERTMGSSNSENENSIVDDEIRQIRGSKSRRSLIPPSDIGTTLPENIIGSSYRGPSPVTSSNGSINSRDGSLPKRNGVAWKAIALSENLVDSLSNQSNTSRLPYSHTLLSGGDSEDTK